MSVAKPNSTPGKGANLYVSNLEGNTGEEVLREIFSPFGTIMEAKALMGFFFLFFFFYFFFYFIYLFLTLSHRL